MFTWHPSEAFKKHIGGSLLLTMEVGGLVEVMSWVLAWRPLQGFQFWSRSRNARVLATEMLRVFRG